MDCEVTQKMLEVAMKKAVELKVIPRWVDEELGRKARSMNMACTVCEKTIDSTMNMWRAGEISHTQMKMWVEETEAKCDRRCLGCGRSIRCDEAYCFNCGK